MLRLLKLLLALRVLQLSEAVEIARFENGVTAQIAIMDQHPALVDHRKVLILHHKNELITQLPLYPDGGQGSPCFVYHGQQEGAITLIDCNGKWVSLDKQGEIAEISWKWMQTPPDTFIAKAAYDRMRKRYVLSTEKPQDLAAIYLFKDP